MKITNLRRFKPSKKTAIKGAVAAGIISVVSGTLCYATAGPFNYSRNVGQYWEYVNERSALDNGKSIEDIAREDNYFFISKPDPEILRVWPLTEDNAITATTSGDKPMKIFKSRATRQFLRPYDIPEVVKRADILVEDQDFYKHHGINWRGKLRAIKTAASRIFGSKSRIVGGSGITEQVAKLIFTPRGEVRNRSGMPGILGKAAELMYAKELEDIYTKEEILAFHLNNSSFGNGNYGINSAAHD